MRNFNTEDFSGSGQYLVRNDAERNKFKDTGFLSTVMYKVGYSHGNGFSEVPSEGNIMMLVSMADGWVQNGHFDKQGSEDSSKWKFVQWNGKQALCDYLNSDSQEMRFATQEEVVRVVLYQSSRWR